MKDRPKNKVRHKHWGRKHGPQPGNEPNAYFTKAVARRRRRNKIAKESRRKNR